MSVRCSLSPNPEARTAITGIGEKMTKTSKAFACVFTAFLAFAGAAQTPSLAQTEFPKQPIHFIVGFAAGGGNDLFARVVVQKLQENTGFTTVIDNKVGAGGRIAADYVA